MSGPFPKNGELRCPAILARVRRWPCRECAERSFEDGDYRQASPTEAHHFPAKGMGGAHIRDDMVIPLCRKHHEDAQAYRIPAGIQHAWVNETRARFLDEATIEEIALYVNALNEWKRRAFAAQAVPS